MPMRERVVRRRMVRIRRKRGWNIVIKQERTEMGTMPTWDHDEKTEKIEGEERISSSKSSGSKSHRDKRCAVLTPLRHY